MPAFVLINVEVGAEEEVKKKILEIPEVEEAYQVYGTYDMIIKLKAEDKEKLKNAIFKRKIISKRIRTIKGVGSTMTLITVE